MPDLVKYGIIFLVAIVTGIILTVIVFLIVLTVRKIETWGRNVTGGRGLWQ